MNSRRTDTLRRVLATASFAFLAFAGCRQREIPPEVSQTIQATVQSQTVPAAIRDEKERKRAWGEMRHFYEQRKFQPAWLTANGPRPQAQELLQAIDASASEGLDPRRY